MTISHGAIALILALAQATTPAQPVRIGLTSLSTQELAELEKVAGGKPWLINTARGQIGTVVELYLPPDKTSPQARMGTVVSFLRNFDGTATPRVFRRERYAQIAIQGRPFDELNGEQDINRPFRIAEASLEDAELISIVRFIRTSPILPGANSPRSGAVRGDLPITDIRRVPQATPNSQVVQVKVTIRLSDFTGQDVLLEKKGEGWVVTSVGEWIA